MHKKILVVEDAPDLLEAITLALEDEGFEVMNAVNAESAQDLVRTRPPDLAILDMKLPGMSGTELGEAMRKALGIPIVIFTNVADKDEVVDALGRGADDYVLKDSGIDELMDRVKVHLEKHLLLETVVKEDIGDQPVLVADPNDEDRGAMVELQKSLGYPAQEATLGVEAVDIVTQGTTQLIILEPDMPDIDSFDLLEALFTVKGRPQVEVLVMTKKRSPEWIRKMKFYKVLGIIDKPWNVSKIDLELRSALSKAKVPYPTKLAA